MSDDLMDMSIFGELQELMGEAISMLVDKYLEQSAEYMQQLNDAMASGDGTTAAQMAHPLKSSSRQLGLVPLSNLAETIEYGIKEEGGITDAVKEAHAAIGTKYDESVAALKAVPI